MFHTPDKEFRQYLGKLALILNVRIQSVFFDYERFFGTVPKKMFKNGQ